MYFCSVCGKTYDDIQEAMHCCTERLERKRNAPLTSKYFRMLIMKIREMEERTNG